jgi:hypothetical protein
MEPEITGITPALTFTFDEVMLATEMRMKLVAV